MKHTKIFITIVYNLIFSFSCSFCCDNSLSTPTEVGRCEELIRENEKRQKELADKYDLATKTAPKEKRALEQKKVEQESEHLERDYTKRIQDLHLD